MVVSLHDLHMMKKVMTWPAERGVIDYSRPRYWRGMRTYHWSADISGHYVGSDHKFEVLSLGYGIAPVFSGKKWAEKICIQYPAGTELDVYHEADHSGSAILVRGNSTRPTWTLFCIGLFLGLLPFFLYVYGRLTGYKPPA